MDLLNSMCSSGAGKTDDRQELVAGRILHFNQEDHPLGQAWLYMNVPSQWPMQMLLLLSSVHCSVLTREGETAMEILSIFYTREVLPQF